MKKDLSSYICSIAASTNADVVILLESPVSPQVILQALRQNVSQDFYYPRASEFDLRFHCFCRDPKLDLSEAHSAKRFNVRKLQIGAHATLLALVHGPDVRNYDYARRQEFIYNMVTQLSYVKKNNNIDKLILLGDFNLNPFDEGMNLATGLNAMMTKACVKPRQRTYLEEKYDFYYNPMWGLFGDTIEGPSGTIYDTSNQGPYGWSMFDQVILHHSVVEHFHAVKILTEAGATSLMNRMGRPDSTNVSDHFPILVDFCEVSNE